MLRNSAQTWGSMARTLHWGVALLLIVQTTLGFIAEEAPLSPTKLELFVWHKSVGMLILALILIRLGWRAANPTPALPAGTPAWERYAARTSHALLYLLVIAIPLTGWIINSAANIPLRLFFVVPLPDIVAPDKALAERAATAHFALWVWLAVLVALHAAAALRHHFGKRNDVLLNMLGGKA